MQRTKTAQGPPAEHDTAVCTIRPRKCSRQSGRRANSCSRHAALSVAVLHARQPLLFAPCALQVLSPSEVMRKH